MNYEQKVVNMNFASNDEYNQYLKRIKNLGWEVESTNSQPSKFGYSVSLVIKRNKDLKNFLRFQDLENKTFRASKAMLREKKYLFDKHNKDSKIYERSRICLKIGFFVLLFEIIFTMLIILSNIIADEPMTTSDIVNIILHVLIIVLLIGGYIFAFIYFKKFKYDLPITNEYVEEIMSFEKELYNKGQKLSKEIRN